MAPTRRGSDPLATRSTERLGVDAKSIARAATLIERGGLVAFPTETVYGLGARADRSEAVRAIFEAKGRPSTNPLIVHVVDRPAAEALATRWTQAAEVLARAFWPGPLTLIVEAKAGVVASEVTALGATVGLRVPDHDVARALLERCGLPIAAPSANLSTALSPTTAAHVLGTLDGRIDAVIDGGPTRRGIESTIVDVTGDRASLLRAGAVELAAIARLVEVVDRSERTDEPQARSIAPGGFARHYAPRARLVLAPADRVRDEVLARRASGEIVGALEHGVATVDAAPNEALPNDPDGFAAGLYAALHRLDDARCTVVVAAEAPSDAAWAAVRDRLRRASSA